MFRRLLLVALVATVALPSLALADHSYSHRYVVYGRVVDAEGNPVPATTVDLGTQNFPGAEGNCAAQPRTETDAFGRTETRPVTNEHGEFIFCFHAHEINRVEPPTGILKVEEFNFTHEFRFDPYIRMTFLPVKLDEVVDRADRTVQDRHYTVVGRIWEDAGDRVTVEGIGVFGHTIDQSPVNVTLTLPDGTTISNSTRTNNYGDFAVRLPVTARPTGGTVTVTDGTGKVLQSSPVDPEVGATVMNIHVEEPADPFVRGALIATGVIVGLIVLGVLGWMGYRRMSERREVEAARASSSRKRARR